MTNAKIDYRELPIYGEYYVYIWNYEREKNLAIRRKIEELLND